MNITVTSSCKNYDGNAKYNIGDQRKIAIAMQKWVEVDTLTFP